MNTNRTRRQQTPPAPMKMWLAGPMEPAVEESLRRLRRMRDVVRVAVMPDVHLSQEMCIGIAFATQRLIYPSAVGGDIGCGYAAVAVGEPDDAGLIDPSKARQLLDAFRERIMIHRRSRPMPCRWLEATRLSDESLDRIRRDEGRHELGTLGRGNHFLELQQDVDDGRWWLMVHSGSRCMGQAVLQHHLQQTEGASAGMRYLIADSDTGRAYLHDMAWARGYAAINRLMMLRLASDAVTQCTGMRPDWRSLFNRDHNHVMRERHRRHGWFVHRKGASRARRHEPGIIPGSMGATTFHTMGRGVPESLCSSSHGAGRVLSRAKARQAVRIDELQRQNGDLIYDQRLAGLREEAPSAYRDIHRVMQAQRSLVHVVRELKPRICLKGA